jgi:hypothetical protein
MVRIPSSIISAPFIWISVWQFDARVDLDDAASTVQQLTFDGFIFSTVTVAFSHSSA